VRAALEVADIFRRHGEAYRQAHGTNMGRVEHRVISAITACRTAALGGHVEQCADCGATQIAYNSCLMGKFRNGELASRRAGDW
jgi:Transposase zinc-binding domain